MLLKEVFTGRSGLNCEKECPNNFQIYLNTPRIGGGSSYDYV